MNRPLVIVEYDPQWPLLYEEEKAMILSVIEDKILAIEHIGSTAVPGLGAKPIIDILAGVSDLDIAQVCIDLLSGIGYEYLPETNPPVPERRYFRKREPQLCHLHMCEYLGGFWYSQVLFRDYLRAHPEVAEEYYELKIKLAQEFVQDRLAYTLFKTEFIERVIEKARKELK